MKKLTPFLFAIVLAVGLFFLLPEKADAAGTATVTASKEIARVGDEITFTVSLSGVANGTSSSPLVTYSDDYFEFVSYEYKKTSFHSSFIFTYDKTNKAGAQAFSDAINFNGDYFAITLKVKAISPDPQTVGVRVQVKNGSTTVADVSGSVSVKLECAIHTWGDWTESVPATYDAAGVETHTCSVCGEIESREIARLKRLESVEVKTAPAKAEYEVGESLDTTGLALTLIYNYGENGEATEGFATEGFSSELGGEKTVTVTYEGKTTTFTVAVVKRISSIAVKTQPVKTEYRIGESLDTAGLVLTVSYNDGTEEEITEGFAVSGFDSSQNGEKTVTVTYDGKMTTFTVQVYRIVASAAIHPASKTSYRIGEELDLEGLYITLIYSDGSQETVSEGFTATGFDSALGGEKTVTVSYHLYETAFKVTVVKEPLSLSVKTEPGKKQYEVGETLNTTGLVLTLLYNDGTGDEITTGFAVEGFDSSKGGIKTVKVSYEGLETGFEVEVIKRPMTLQVKTLPKTQYEIGETLDTEGMVLTLFYNDGTTEEIREGYTTTDLDSAKGGEKTIAIAYAGVSAKYTVNVIRRITSSMINSMPVKSEYFYGEEADFTGMNVELHYNDGTSEIVTDGFTSKDFDTSTPGKKTALIQYDTFMAYFDYEVIKISGDVNGNEEVNDADAIYLLMHTFFPEMYPLKNESACDYNRDGEVNDADAIYLLMYTFFPEMYPIDLQAGKAHL